MTPQEVDLVKEAQELDKRIDVFVKAADRRLLVLNGVDAASAKQLKKDAELWGELPRNDVIGAPRREADDEADGFVRKLLGKGDSAEHRQDSHTRGRKKSRAPLRNWRKRPHEFEAWVGAKYFGAR